MLTALYCPNDLTKANILKKNTETCFRFVSKFSDHLFFSRENGVYFLKSAFWVLAHNPKWDFFLTDINELHITLRKAAVKNLSKLVDTSNGKLESTWHLRDKKKNSGRLQSLKQNNEI